MNNFLGALHFILDSGPMSLYDASGCYYTCKHKIFSLHTVSEAVMQVQFCYQWMAASLVLLF